MGKNLVQKIISEHLVKGEMLPGKDIQVKVDQVITQDATGTMTWLQFEAIGIEKVQVETAVSYVDHNTLQVNFRNADDHKYLQTVAVKSGAYFSRPGNGICHQVHLERFAKPGAIQLGTDSHTPTAGGIGAIAIGVGGLDAATVLAGAPFEMKFPKVLKVHLTGSLQRPWTTAMDIILEVLRRRTVKGGLGFIVEYGGPGVKSLNITERATITNMGAELGATTSLFPSDEQTLEFLKLQDRADVYRELLPDDDAEYDDIEKINLDELEPLVAKPHSPDNVVKLSEIEGLELSQVAIGSCTNSSFQVLASVASVLEGNTVADNVSMTVSPGSKQVYTMIAQSGHLGTIIGSGARLLESACGPCIGMGSSPGTNQVSLRSFNRNFPGRSGEKTAQVYLANPMVCAASAIEGKVFNPKTTKLNGKWLEMPDKILINDNMIVPPAKDPSSVQVIKGPNIKPVAVKEPLTEPLKVRTAIKLEDNISTDDIMPAGSLVLQFRSNIPAISDYVFSRKDPEFVKRVKDWNVPFAIIAADNYGQGSSREHAAIAPMFLGLNLVIAKSFARIHRQNLINFGVLPLEFDNPADYEGIDQEDELEVISPLAALKTGESVFEIKNHSKGTSFKAKSIFSERDVDCIKLGGLLPYTKNKYS